MNGGAETLFTAALGLQAPWSVSEVDLNTGKRRIDFTVTCGAHKLACPHCGASEQGIHDRVDQQWRHLDSFQFEAWLHAQVPRVKCASFGKTMQVEVPWARPGSGFTLLFEALALSLCGHLPVSQAAGMLRVAAKRLWSRIEHHVTAVKAKQDISEVRIVGIDETSVNKGHEYITVVHGLEQKRLLFACAGRDHGTLNAFAQNLSAHHGKPETIEHVCMDMSAAYIKGVTASWPQAQINYDRLHVMALANAAMDEVRRGEVRRGEMRIDAAAVSRELGTTDRKVLKGLMWGMRKNPQGWSDKQTTAMHWLQHSNLRSARAWRLKQAWREVCAQAVQSNDAHKAEALLKAWLSWAKRSRLEPFKRLASTITERLAGVVRRMLDGRSKAYVEAMNGLLQPTKTAARGFSTVRNVIAIAYLRMAKLKHLPANPFAPAAPLDLGITRHVC